MVQIVNGAPVYTVRIKFRKVGTLQYISHLDLVRTMNKIVTRTALPIWYTEGFNPRPKIIFAAPLSIGTESECEFMDLRLTERIPEEEVAAAFNRNLTDEMRVESAYYTDRTFAELKWFSYTVRITTNGADEALAQKCTELLTSDKVEVLKKTKKGEATVDIRPLIKSACCTADGGTLCLSCVLSADQAAYLNPEYIIKVLKAECGILSGPDLTAEYYTIVRDRAHLSDMSDFE